MSKKNYQINVIDAENIKNQNNQENKVTLDNQNKPENEGVVENQNEPKNLKTGLMIGGLITFFLAMCFMVFTLYYTFQTYSSDNDAQKAVTFIIFILSVGWISYIPGAICSIASLFLHAFVIKSTSKAQKVVGIIFTILSVLFVIAYLAIAIYIMTLPNG